MSETQSENRGSALERLRQLFAKRGVEYKLVKFRYNVDEPRLVPPIAAQEFYNGQTPLNWLPTRSQPRARSGIVYRDETDPAYPWWYIDAGSHRPVWLPNDTLQAQISFAVRRTVELMREREFERGISGMMPLMAPDRNKTAGTDWNARFLKENGTDFDPKSPLDLSKMRHLQSL